MDPIEEWQAGHARVSELVVEVDRADPAAMDVAVPATPDWRARDLLAHVVGLGADVVAGDEPDDHNPDWTQAQVEARRDRSVSEILAEWDDVAPRLVEWMRRHGVRPLNDLVIHEQDLRGALDRPGARDTAGLRLVRDVMTDRLGGRLAATHLGSLALVEGAGGWEWCSTGPLADTEVVLRGSTFDLVRALTSRRTADQLDAMTSFGDVGPYLDVLAALGPLPAEPLAGE